MTRQATYELQIVAGLQAGARQPLDLRQPVSIGTALDNDIVLLQANPETDDSQCIVLLRDGQFWIEVVSGSVQLNQRRLHSGEQASISIGEEILAADTRLRINDLNRDALLQDVEHLAETEAEPLQRDGTRPVAPPFRPGRLSPAIAMISGFALLLYLLIPDVVGSVSRFTTDQPPSLTERMAALGFEHVRLEHSEKSELPHVVGRVDNRDQWLRLSAAVRQAEPAVIDVQIDDSLAESISDIYRMHGVQASVTVEGHGHARAESRTSDETLQRIQAAIEHDLPDLERFEATNSPPPREVDPVRPDPGKTVKMVVAGEPAYLLTRDQSRYFIGSMLPSGHVVRKISDGKVIVALDGVESTLEF